MTERCYYKEGDKSRSFLTIQTRCHGFFFRDQYLVVYCSSYQVLFVHSDTQINCIYFAEREEKGF